MFTKKLVTVLALCMTMQATLIVCAEYKEREEKKRTACQEQSVLFEWDSLKNFRRNNPRKWQRIIKGYQTAQTDCTEPEIETSECQGCTEETRKREQHIISTFIKDTSQALQEVDADLKQFHSIVGQSAYTHDITGSEAQKLIRDRKK